MILFSHLIFRINNVFIFRIRIVVSNCQVPPAFSDEDCFVGVGVSSDDDNDDYDHHHNDNDDCGSDANNM